MRLHHVQVACPVAGEGVARRFYLEGLGLVEVDKPAGLRARGGLWLRTRVTEGDGAEIHIGVEDPFVPARKAHPALLLDSVAELGVVGSRLRRLGYDVDDSQRLTFPGYERLHAFDGHGNRIELLAIEPAVPAGTDVPDVTSAGGQR